MSESEPFSVEIPRSGQVVKGAEVGYQNPDGKGYSPDPQRWASYGDDHRILGSLVGLTDVGERKLAEAEVTRLNRELQQRIQELEAVLKPRPSGLPSRKIRKAASIGGDPQTRRCSGARGAELSRRRAPIRPRPHPHLQDGRELAVDELPMQRAVRGERVSGQIMDVVRADGRTLRLYSNASPLLDEQGRPRGAVGAFLDITEISLAQDALKRNDATLRGILNATKESVWLFSSEGIVLMTNDMALLRFGKSAEEVIGRSITEILPAELAASRLEHLKEVVETGQPIEFEDKRIGIHFRHSFYPVRDADGRVISIASFSRDVTERKQAERALQDSETRLRFALETIDAGAWDLDLVDHTAFRSLEHDRIFGYAELLPQWTYEMFLDHVLLEDRDEVDAKFRHAIETQGDWSFECRIQRSRRQSPLDFGGWPSSR